MSKGGFIQQLASKKKTHPGAVPEMGLVLGKKSGFERK
jgi:hypothetical protein